MSSDSRLVSVNFLLPDGTRTEVTDKPGLSVMDFAVDHGVAGIDSQCGGACICTMCHCYISSNWFSKVGPISFEEEEMLEFIPQRKANSRLSCQVIVTAELDGLTIQIDSHEEKQI